MDDFDLLDATIDPTDVKSIKKRNDIELEIENEETRIKAKLLWKMAFSESNPMRIDEWKELSSVSDLQAFQTLNKKLT